MKVSIWSKSRRAVWIWVTSLNQQLVFSTPKQYYRGHAHTHTHTLTYVTLVYNKVGLITIKKISLMVLSYSFQGYPLLFT